MKYKLTDYYKNDFKDAPTPLWMNIVIFPIVLLMWLTNYPPTRGE